MSTVTGDPGRIDQHLAEVVRSRDLARDMAAALEAEVAELTRERAEAYRIARNYLGGCRCDLIPTIKTCWRCQLVSLLVPHLAPQDEDASRESVRAALEAEWLS